MERVIVGNENSQQMVDSWNGRVERGDSLLPMAPALAWVVVANARATKLFRWEPGR